MRRMLPHPAPVDIANFDAIWGQFCPPEPQGDALLRWLAMLTPPAATLLELSVGPVPQVGKPTGTLPPARLRELGTHKPRVGRPYWTMEAAFRRDLAGATSREVAEAFGQTTDTTRDHRSRGADRYVSDGRKLLNQLGAWPWALVDGGRLPRNWRVQPLFAHALARWHWEGWERGYLGQMRAADWAGGDHDRWRRDSRADIWRIYLDRLLLAKQRGEERRVREASVVVGKPVPAIARYVENVRYVLLLDDTERFFKTLADAESWIAANVPPTHSGRRTIMTIEGYRAQHAA